MRWIVTMLLILTVAVFAQGPGDIVITEVMQNPSDVVDNLGEWFEIYNTTASAIDIDGWTIRDNDIDDHIISNGGPLTIPAGGFLVFGNNADGGTNGGLTVDYQYSGLILANGADEIVLEAPGPVEIDRIEWDGGPVWPDPTGASMTLLNFQTDNNVGTNWTTSTLREPTYQSNGNADSGSPGTLGSDQTLPVELASFTAVAGDGKVTLRWATQSEVNNVRFDILKAAERNGAYSKIGERPGQFNSNQLTNYSFVDNFVATGSTYWYKLVDVDVNGMQTEHGPISATPQAAGTPITTINSEAPQNYKLYPGYPNPFNPSTNLKFDVPGTLQKMVDVRVEVFNSLGQKVRTLFNGSVEAGTYSVTWDGATGTGRAVPGGVYFAVMTAGFYKETVKMTLVR